MQRSALLLALAWLSGGACAQSVRSFQWGFKNTFAGALAACTTVTIEVKSMADTGSGPPPGATFGKAPYYMITYEVGGRPQTQVIGSDRSDLKWTIRHQPGKHLLLSMVDADGNSGGSPPALIPVVGSNTSCITAPPATSLNFRANITSPSTIKTCQPWGFEVTGGVRPYTLSLPALNSPVVTNITIGAETELDLFTYINRADPNGLLLGAISDGTGAWAPTTFALNTTGGDASKCRLDSKIGFSALVPFFQEQPPEPKPKGANVGVIVAGVLVPLFLIAILAGVGFWLWRRRRAIQAPDGQDTKPRVFDGESQSTKGVIVPGHVQESSSNFSKLDSFNEREKEYHFTPNRPQMYTTEPEATSGASSFLGRAPASPVMSPPGLSTAGAMSHGTYAGSVRDSIRTNSTNPRRSQFPRKPMAVFLSPSDSVSSSSTNLFPLRDNMPSRSISAIPSNSRYTPQMPQRSATTATGASNRRESRHDGIVPLPEELDIVIQHQDGGAASVLDSPAPVVHELPPPYMDRSLRGPAPSEIASGSSSRELPRAGGASGSSSRGPAPFAQHMYPNEKATPLPGMYSTPPSPTSPSPSALGLPCPLLSRPATPGA